MDNKSLKQQITLWKAIPIDSQDETDEFIEALISHIEELEEQVEDLDNQLIEMSEYD